jgi:HSP20 family molecular chaperone IbpA
MFGKKTCPKCSEKVSKSYEFCPYCGSLFGKKRTNDYGMLGIDDELDEQNSSNPFESLFGKISASMLNKMFAGTMKMLEKEMQKELKNSNQNMPHNLPQKTNFEIIINGRRINPENIKFAGKIMPNEEDENEGKPKKKHIPKISSESMKKISKLPKKEPSTNIRRLANKVIYELEIPGVKSIEDISIVRLENSIEIKALAEDRKNAYSKLIPINLPIMSYELADGKLILELDAKN